MTPEFAVAATSAAAVSPDTLALVRATMQAAVLSAWIQAGATLLIGAAQFVLIWAGLRRMRAASEARDRQLDAQGDTLAALARMMDARTEAITRGLEQQGAALVALVERTGKGQSA